MAGAQQQLQRQRRVQDERFVPLHGAGLPPAYTILRAKIIAVAKDMKPMAKRDRNPDQGWSFVSIDDYYAEAGAALLAAGVSWVCAETAYNQGEGGLSTWTFRFDIYDDEGNSWNDASQITVPHEYDGPQCAGKVVSYAEKVFLRQLLKLVTGEPDADISPQKKTKPKSARIDIQLPDVAPAAVMDYEALERLLIGAASETELNLLIEKNKRSILHAKNNDPEIYAKLAELRAMKIKEFENDE